MSEEETIKSNRSQNLVGVIRDELRYTITAEQKNHREAEVHKRRVTLGGDISNEHSWSSDDIKIKVKELQKKSLGINDYTKLQNSLVQSETNIRTFLSTNNIISALIRDLSSLNPTIQLAAAHCCCNIALGNKSHCTTLCKYAGPYLVEQLDTLNNPLLEVTVWTIGNLCSGSKNALKVLCAQGCLPRLLSLLQDSDLVILPSLIYAITHYIHNGSEFISDEDVVKVATAIIHRNLYESTDALWVLALLSSKPVCTSILYTISSQIFDKLMRLVGEVDKQCGIDDIKGVTAIIRILANLIPESSELFIDIIFNNQNYNIDDIQKLFNKLLIHPYIHVRKETLWLLGNFYNHSQHRVNNKVKELLPHLNNLQLAIQSVS